MTEGLALLKTLEDQVALEPNLSGQQLVDRTRRDLLLTGVGAGTVMAASAAPTEAQDEQGPTGPARVLLVYTTDTNSTRQMAMSVAEGVRTVEGVHLTVRCWRRARRSRPLTWRRSTR